MRKLFSFKMFLVTIFSCTILFTACDSFLSGSELQTEIEQIVADLNAPSIQFNISSEGMGEISPSGITNFKTLSNKKFYIRFIESEQYQFEKWDITVGEEHNPEYIQISKSEENENDYIVSVQKDCELINIRPICLKRPLTKFTTPEYQSNGISKDRSIVISFTKPVSLDSFRFSKKELVDLGKAEFNEEGEFIRVKKADDSEELVEYKYDENELIYAYVDNSGTHFKNIEIVSGYDSVAEHYKAPYFEKSAEGEEQNLLLRIDVDNLNPISLGTSETKDITVTLCRNIFDASENKITMGNDKSWYFKINASTDIKEKVTVSSSYGKITPSGTSSYDMGASTQLKFEPDSRYQFLYWKSNSDCAVILEPQSLTTSFIIANQSNDGTEIIPVCAERPFVEKFEPELKNDGIFKDSTIAITFNKELSTKNNLKNISISCDGMSVNANFKDAVLNGKTITIAADSANFLNIEKGSTKTISVKIPPEFYYELDDGTKIELGGEGDIRTYKVSSETSNKTSITFAEVTGASVNITGTKSYNIGEKINLKTTVASEYEFTGWKITDSENKTVSESFISIEDASSLETSFTVKGKITGVTIAPCVYIKPALTNTDSSEPVKKDTSIVLNFNHALSKNFDLSKIKVLCNGESVLLNYNAPEINSSRNTVTFTPKMTNLIEVEEGQTKNVTVSILRSNLFYEADAVLINAAEDQSYSFTINSTTNAKTTVNVTGIPEPLAETTGIISPSGINEYSIGQKVNLIADLKENFIFKEWAVTGADADSVTVNSAENKETFFTVMKEAADVVINPVYYENFRITDQPQIEIAGIEKDTEVIVIFNKPLSSECDLTKVKIESDYISVYDNYELRINSNELIFIPKQQNLIKFSDENDIKNIEITIPGSFGYIYNDNSVVLGEDKVIVYRINNNTQQRAKINFTNNSLTDGEILLNGKIVNNTEKNLILRENYTLEFRNNNNYNVKYWIINGVKNTDDVTDPENEVVVSSEENNTISYIDELTGKEKISIADRTLTLKINKPAADIEITPVTYLIPKVSSVNPGPSRTIDMESPIIIYFNKQMDSSSFDDIVLSTEKTETVNESYRRMVYTSSNGNKSYYNVCLTNCFEIERKTDCIILKPKTGQANSNSKTAFEKFNLFLAENELSIGYKNLDVYVYAMKIKDSAGNYLEDNENTYVELASVKYERKMETDAPEFRSLNVYANDQNESECMQTVSISNFVQNTTNTKVDKRNYTNRKVFIDADVFESEYGSGLRYLHVDVDYCYSEEKIDVRESRKLSTYDYIFTSQLTEDETEKGLFHLRNYEYTLPDWGDGFYLLSFKVQDMNNNVSPEAKYLICNDTTLDISDLKLLTSNYPTDTEQKSVKKATKNQGQYLLLNYSGKSNKMAAIRGGYMKYKFNWTEEDDSGNLVLKTKDSGIWNNSPTDNLKWSFSEFYFSGWDARRENLVMLEVEDLVKNKASKVFTIPGPAFVTNVTVNSSNTYVYVAPPVHPSETEIAKVCELYGVTRDQIDINPDSLTYSVFCTKLTSDGNGGWTEGSYSYVSSEKDSAYLSISNSKLTQFGSNYRLCAKVKYTFNVGSSDYSFWGAMGQPYDVLASASSSGPVYTPIGSLSSSSLQLGKYNSGTCYADVRLSSTFESDVDYFCKVNGKYYKMPFTSSNKIAQCQFLTGQNNKWYIIAKKNGIEKTSSEYTFTEPASKDRTAPSSYDAPKPTSSATGQKPIKYSYDGKYILLTNLYDSQNNLIDRNGFKKVVASYYRVSDGMTELKASPLYGFEVSNDTVSPLYVCEPVSIDGHNQFAIPVKDMLQYTTPYSLAYDYNMRLDLLIEDSQGNYLEIPRVFYDRYYALNNRIKVSYSSNTLNVSIDKENTNRLGYGKTGTIDFTNYKINIQKYDDTKNGWVNTVFDDSMLTSDNARTYSSTAISDDFLRITVSAELTEGSETYRAFSVPVYCKPSFLVNDSYVATYVETNNSISILNAGYGYKNYCYAKTVVSSKNWGESVEDWERYGVECNKGYFKDAGTYYITEQEILNDIPELDYYCVIMYYANGKSQISSVRQKY